VWGVGKLGMGTMLTPAQPCVLLLDSKGEIGLKLSNEGFYPKI